MTLVDLRRPPGAPIRSARRWVALVAIVFAELVIMLDNTIVNTALPRRSAGSCRPRPPTCNG